MHYYKTLDVAREVVDCDLEYPIWRKAVTLARNPDIFSSFPKDVSGIEEVA